MRQVVTPRIVLDGENLSPELINENLRAIAAALDDNRSQRYTYSEVRLPLAGVANTDAQVLREIALRRPGASNAVEVVGVEVVLYAAAGATWTLSCSDTTFPSLAVDTAGATTEASGSSDVPIPIPSSSSDVLFTLSCPTASTITDGDLVVHLRCDRGDQGADFAGYDPPPFTSFTSTAAATLEAQVDTAMPAAVAAELAADDDLRAEVYAWRNFGPTGTRVFRAPSGAREILRLEVYVVAAAGRNVTAEVSGGTLTLFSATANGAGVAARAVAGSAPGATATTADDPTDPTDDTLVTVTDNGVGAVLLAYAVLWWR